MLRKVTEDSIYNGIALASKTDHVNSRAECVHEPIEGIDLMDVPQLECKLLYKNKKVPTCTMSVKSLDQRGRKLTTKEAV